MFLWPAKVNISLCSPIDMSHSSCSSPYSTGSSSSPPPCIPTSQFNQLPYMVPDLHYPAYANSMAMAFPYSDMPPHLQVTSVWPCEGLPTFPEVFDHPSPNHGSLDGEIRIELVDQSLLPNDQPIEYYPPTPPPAFSSPGRYSPSYNNPGRGTRRRQNPKKPPKPPVQVDATEIQGKHLTSFYLLYHCDCTCSKVLQIAKLHLNFMCLLKEFFECLQILSSTCTYLLPLYFHLQTSQLLLNCGSLFCVCSRNPNTPTWCRGTTKRRGSFASMMHRLSQHSGGSTETGRI